MAMLRWLLVVSVIAAGSAGAAAPARAQDHAPGQEKHTLYRADATKAISVTRTVLERQGYTVVSVERTGTTRVVYYRRGNNGRGKGKGPLRKLVIRTVKDRVVFEDTAPELMVDIDVKLRL